MTTQQIRRGMKKNNLHNYTWRTWACAVLVSLLTACAIENDIPYPLREGNITAMEVEGQCDAEGNATTQATINKSDGTVMIYVDDSVDKRKIRITKFTVSNDATLVVPESLCNNYEKFPQTGFESLDDLPLSADTRMNFSNSVDMVLRTYQDYAWTIQVEQIIVREVLLENQVGNAVIDPINQKAVIYVSKEQDLSKVHVSTFKLGGKNGRVAPDPTATETFDFTQPRQFLVSHGWEETSKEWTVYVYQTDESDAGGEATIQARTTGCILTGTVQQGKTPRVEYKKESESAWTQLKSGQITIKGTSYTATLTGLTPATSYVCRVSIDGNAGKEQTFTTTAATPLTDGDFDQWHLDGKLWNPWAESGTSYWDTGNRGATTVGESNSVPTDETCNGSGKAALLESKWVVLKFAAGNIFAGKYVKTVGTNGVLNFGQPFTAFPSKLRINYKYTPVTIDKVGEDALQYLKGRMDSCHIYVALTDWDQPREIRTRPSERQLFDKDDSHIIAYAELIKGETVSSYQQVDLELKYRTYSRTPKYIAVVATASKYGDYFTGGVGSKLWLDNFELIYD